MNLKKMIEELQEKGKLELKDGSIIIKLSQDEFNFYNSIQKKNTGNYNSGYWNSGNRNSSNFNSGSCNYNGGAILETATMENPTLVTIITEITTLVDAI